MGEIPDRRRLLGVRAEGTSTKQSRSLTLPFASLPRAKLARWQLFATPHFAGFMPTRAIRPRQRNSTPPRPQRTGNSACTCSLWSRGVQIRLRNRVLGLVKKSSNRTGSENQFCGGEIQNSMPNQRSIRRDTPAFRFPAFPTFLNIKENCIPDAPAILAPGREAALTTVSSIGICAETGRALRAMALAATTGSLWCCQMARNWQ